MGANRTSWIWSPKRVGALVVAVGLTAAACGDDGGGDGPGGEDGAEAPAEEAAIFPGDEWAYAEPEELGFDPDILDDLAAEAEEQDSQCLVVTRHGQIVAEWYWDDSDATTQHEAFSVTKSISSTLVGLAVGDGLVDLDDPVADYVDAWQGTDSEDVTIRNLISNDSGRAWLGSGDPDSPLDFNDTYVALTAAEDRSHYAIDAYGQADPPGSTWIYNDAAIQVLEPVLSEVTGQSPADFAQDRLFGPIGAEHTEMTGDAAGHTATYFGAQTTCQDMARFGYLFLNDGVWDGEQVLPDGWVEEATQPSQDIYEGYGYLWWLNVGAFTSGADEDATGEEAPEGAGIQAVPGAPEDLYWAQGLGGQTIQVHPGTDTVVTRMGNSEGSYGSAEVTRFVTEALVEPAD